ncbi:hypothetical protein BU15DRAFT_69393 [Melanogaster broomeanus]|nr:hypothetical protein BU15DRAFT_69393 [Melanogaster broomeanus]
MNTSVGEVTDGKVSWVRGWWRCDIAWLERNRVRRQACKDELATWEAERDLGKGREAVDSMESTESGQAGVTFRPSPSGDDNGGIDSDGRITMSLSADIDAVFLARLTVHQLQNVLLVYGEFGVRWKVKGVTSPSDGGILGKVKGKSKVKNNANSENLGNVTPVDDGEGKEKQNTVGMTMTGENGSDNASLFDGASASVSDTHRITNSSSAHSHSYDCAHSVNGSAQGHTTTTTRNVDEVLLTLAMNVDGAALTFRERWGKGCCYRTMLAATVGSSAAYHTNGYPSYNPPAHYLSAHWLPKGPAQSPTSTQFDTQTPQSPDPQFVKLKDHSIIWEQTVDVEGADGDGDQASYAGADGPDIAEHQGSMLGFEGATDNDGDASLYADSLDEVYAQKEDDTNGGASDYSDRSAQTTGEQPLRSIGSKIGLRVDDALGRPRRNFLVNCIGRITD